MKQAIFFLFILMIAACQFAPDGNYYVELTEPGPPELQVINLSLDQDTIFLTYYQDIQFNFSAGENRILQVSVLIDGEEKYTRSNYQDSFTILASDIAEGFHKLTFSVVTNSNSGSIADLLGAEGFQFVSSEWTLICLKNDRHASYIDKKIENGYLKLSWEPHNKVDFKSYKIVKRSWQYGEIMNEYRTKQPFWIDKAYVGESAFYEIYTEYHSDASYFFQWAELFILNSLPQMAIRTTVDGKFEAEWENNAYSHAVDRYKLIDVSDQVNPVTLYHSAPEDQNSVVIPNVVFGEQKRFQLLSVPKFPDKPITNDSLYYQTTNFYGPLGEKSFEFEDLVPLSKDRVLLLQNQLIYNFSVATGQKNDSLKYNWLNCGRGYQRISVSPKGNYFTTNESCENKLVLMQTAHLSDYHAYPVNHVFTDGMYFFSLPVSDNGIVIAKDYGRINLYDVFNNKVIGYISSVAAVYEEGISTNGDYFFIRTSQLVFYKIANGQIQTIWESGLAYNYVYDFAAFDPDNPEHVIVWDGEKLFHKNVSDFSDIAGFSLPEETILDIDFTSRQLLAYSGGYLSVYHIDSGAMTGKIAAVPDVIRYHSRAHLHNRTIYCRDGVRIQLPNN